MSTTKRPTSVTIIAWLIVLAGAWRSLFAIASWALLAEAAVSPVAPAGTGVAIWYGFGAGVLYLSAGALMLNASPIGRLLYLGFTPVSILVSELLAPRSGGLLLPFLEYVVILWFLTRPAASQYFHGERGATPDGAGPSQGTSKVAPQVEVRADECKDS